LISSKSYWTSVKTLSEEELPEELLDELLEELLDELLAACKRAYESIENEAGLNDDYEDGDINYEAQGTKAMRAAGIKTYPGL